MKNVKKETKQNNKLIKQANETRLLIAFLLTVASACCAATLVNFQNFEALFTARKIALIVFGALSVLTFAWLVISKVRKFDFCTKTLSPSFCFGASLLITIGAWLYMNMYVEISPEMLIIAVISTGALYFVYKIFNKDFFVYSLLTLVSIFALDATRHTGIFAVLSLALCLAMPVVTVLALVLFKKGNGKLTFAGKTFVLNPKFKYYPFVCTAVTTFAGAIATLVIPTVMSMIVIGCAVLFLLIAVIYTIEAVCFS